VFKWSHNFQTFQSGLNETQEGANGLIGATTAPLDDYFLENILEKTFKEIFKFFKKFLSITLLRFVFKIY